MHELTQPANEQGVNGALRTLLHGRTRIHEYGQISRNTVVSEVDEIFTAWSFKVDEEKALSGGIDNDLVVGAIPLTSTSFL